MMKQNKLNLKYSCVFLLTLVLSACSNEAEVVQSRPEQYMINVSVRSGEQHTRAANDIIEQEKIKRFDIFIYEPGDDGAFVKYIGRTSEYGLNNASAAFESSTDFTTPKDVYVVVNNFAWKDKSEEEMKAITKTGLKAMEITCNQNIEGTPDAITNFRGYKKSDSENEPFVMSVSRTGYNFSTAGNAKLELTLIRSYAKVVLKFTTNLGKEDDDKDWIDLKTIRVRAINQVPKVTRLFSEDGSGYTPQLESYVYKESNERTFSAINADLTKGTFGFDSFAEDILALRLFPQDPSSDTDNKSTSLLLDFEVGAVGSPKITNNFKRLIKIGDETKGYQIDPNYAYIITISYGKTTNSITTSCKVVPWNLLSWKQEVEPD